MAWAESMGQDSNEQGFTSWRQRGYLPHRDEPGLIQFVTFRLNDSLPESRCHEWKAFLRIENYRQQRTQLEEYLDRGHGKCWLRQPAIAALTEGALRYFDGQRYQLLAWVIMPNHIHVLVEVWQTPMAKILRSWKGYIAHAANKVLQRQGSFWEREYWDTYMRNEEQLARARRYIEQNPVKAGLIREPKGWLWGSARFRGEDWKLVLPRGAAVPPALIGQRL